MNNMVRLRRNSVALKVLISVCHLEETIILTDSSGAASVG